MVLVPSANVCTVKVDGGTLLVDEQRGTAFPLTTAGSLFWDCVDGISSIDEICDDLSDVLGLDRDRVGAEVERLARELLNGGVATAPGGDGSTSPLDGPAVCGCGAAHDDLWNTPETLTLGDVVVVPESGNECRNSSFPLGPDGEIAVRLVGDDGTKTLVGIRTNDGEAAAMMREQLGHLVVDEPLRFANIDVRIGARRGSLTDAHIVFRRLIEARRTFSRDEAIDAALALVHTFQPPADGVTPMRALALERHGSVVLVADAYVPAVDAHHRRLTAAGYVRHLHTPVLVDSGAGEALLPRESNYGDPTFDRLPISFVVTPGVSFPPDLTLPFRVSRLKILIAGPQRPLRAQHLGALADLVEQVPILRVNSGRPRDLVRTLVEL